MAAGSDELSRIERLSLDIDTRLADVWTNFYGTALDTDDPDALAVFGACIRVAYATGYRDALREDAAGRRSQLLRDHGY